MYLATLDIPQPLNVIVFVVNKKSLFQQTYIYIREGGREEGGGREGRRERERGGEERERERERVSECGFGVFSVFGRPSTVPQLFC